MLATGRIEEYLAVSLQGCCLFTISSSLSQTRKWQYDHRFILYCIAVLLVLHEKRSHRLL